jgi:hypothetical protein
MSQQMHVNSFNQISHVLAIWRNTDSKKHKVNRFLFDKWTENQQNCSHMYHQRAREELSVPAHLHLCPDIPRGNLISKKNCLACKSSLFGKLAVAASMSSA